MKRICAALAILASVPMRCDAQNFIELGVGPSLVSAAPSDQIYQNGFNLRASIGRALSPRVVVRFDAFVNDYQVKTPLFLPCAFPGCSGPSYGESSGGVAGITANILFDVDPRGFFYLTGGAGFYDVYFGPARSRAGVSVGAGVSVPIRGRVRIFVEGRDHILPGDDASPTWQVPVTFGVRF